MIDHEREVGIPKCLTRRFCDDSAKISVADGEDWIKPRIQDGEYAMVGARLAKIWETAIEGR